MAIPKHLENKLAATDKGNRSEYRKRAGRSEKKIAKAFNGRTTVNSGATFGQNDVEADMFSIEDKVTLNASYSLKAAYLKEVEKKAPLGKIPLLTLTFETEGVTYAVIKLNDLLLL